MSIPPLVLPVVIAAFCVWLTVRIINRRERWAMRMAVVFVVGIIGYALVNANIQPGPPIWLGHVSDLDSSSPIFPGLWIYGHHYGWPWTYRTESFKSEHIQIDTFDEFHWLPLVQNAVVGIVPLAGIVLFAGWIINRRVLCQR